MPAIDDDTLLPFSLPAICHKKATAAFNGGLISSDGGVLLLAGADKRLGLISTMAAIIPDHRDPNQIIHTLADILRARITARAVRDFLSIHFAYGTAGRTIVRSNSLTKGLRRSRRSSPRHKFHR